MNWRVFGKVPPWSIAVPVMACLVLALSNGGSSGWALLCLAGAALVASVLAAVHHAEVIALGLPLALGLSAKEVALLVLSLFLASMTLTGGRATVLQGAVHLVVFALFLFLTMVP